jgi:hypothetical protein
MSPISLDWTLTRGARTSFSSRTTRREAIRMLDVNCPDCGRTLIGPRQILAMTNGGDGIEVAYVCWCGRPGAERIGASRRADRRGKKTTPTGVRR